MKKLIVILILLFCIASYSQPIQPAATKERMEDTTGAMVSGNTETLIAVTYDDPNNKLDFVVDEASINHDALTNFVANEHIDWTEATSRMMTTLASEQLRIAYNDSNFVSFTVNSSGNLLVDFAAGSGDIFDLGGLAHIRAVGFEYATDPANVKINMSSTAITSFVGGLQYLRLYKHAIGQDEVIANPSGHDIDFRAASDNQANMLFVDASIDRVGIKTASPVASFHTGGNFAQTVITIDPNDTTPDISGGNIFVTSANGVATAITDLDNPAVGQIIYLVGGSNTNSSTIADENNFALSAAWTASLDNTLTLFVQADNDYIEIGRANN